MRIHRQTLAFSLGSLLAMLLGTLFLLGGSSVKSSAEGAWRSLLPDPDPVLVFVVRDVGAVFDVLAAVDPDRLVAASPEAIALSERRVVAASPEAVGPVLRIAGWEDAPLEIFTPPPSPGREPAAKSRMASLLDKPNLTLIEARYLMSQM